ncbi:hypothetical protein DEU56DRAFT_814499 [Suillus clintonianus]|uniref:uncharacterized protein n=1 Tax=Suillus clintonianus TaxID=1904413 RepID=UPI001B85DE47|nr:uncharacterized protein DEU56DRAFT_814499 [Suillus clintonianus]KAG2131024.1 hypothetical protein DEU56DRAFT_814499 [Suillus clintonianus]
MMAANSTDIMWGPGVIGFVIATAFYGTAFGQYIFYLKYFSQDSKRLKLFIMMVFCLGTINEFALIGMYWSILISCRRSTSLVCTTELPWQMLLGVFMSCLIVFAVHCFYIHRVWIITEHNRLITGIICVFATTSLVFGMITSGLIFFTRSPADLFGKKWAQGSAVAGALCDILITGTVWWFLRPARTGNVRRPNYLEQLTQMFVNMGLFSCIVAITMVVLYQVQNSRLDQFYSAVPGSLLGKTYLNSMMAVLNARKSIRERQQLEVGLSSMELPTIPTIR